MAITFRGRAAVGFAVSLGAVVLLWSGVLDSLAPATRGMVLVAAGVTLLGVVLPLQLRTRALLKDGVQGTVVGAVAGGSHLRSRTYHPVVRFTTADGRTVTFTSGMGFPRQPEIGGAVPVRYRGDNPEQAEIDRAHIGMLAAAPPLLVGVGLLVAPSSPSPTSPRLRPSQRSPRLRPSQRSPRSRPSQRSPRSRRRWWTAPRLRGPRNRYPWGRQPRWRPAGSVTG